MPLTHDKTIIITEEEALALYDALVHIHDHAFSPCASCMNAHLRPMCERDCVTVKRMQGITDTLESLLRKAMA